MAQAAATRLTIRADRRPGGRLDRDGLARAQRPGRRVGRDARPRQPGDPRARLHGEPKRPRAVGRPHRADRRPRPARLPRVLLVDPRRRSRGAVRAATCRSSSRPPARARPRGLACSTGYARPDRRRADHPARGVERGARAAARRRLPVRRHRPADAARRAHPVGLRRAHVGRRPGDAPPARRSGTGGSRRSAARPAGWRPRIAAAATARRSRRPGSCPTRARGERRSSRSPAAARPPTAPARLPEPPTAIFAFNDNIAIGAIQAARARGLRVPEDLSIVGFDDVEHATIVTPELTTVRQPLAEMGRTAVSLLDPAARGAELRDAPRRARDAPRRARLDGAAARRPDDRSRRKAARAR